MSPEAKKGLLGERTMSQMKEECDYNKVGLPSGMGRL